MERNTVYLLNTHRKNTTMNLQEQMIVSYFDSKKKFINHLYSLEDCEYRDKLYEDWWNAEPLVLQNHDYLRQFEICELDKSIDYYRTILLMRS